VLIDAYTQKDLKSRRKAPRSNAKGIRMSPSMIAFPLGSTFLMTYESGVSMNTTHF